MKKTTPDFIMTLFTPFAKISPQQKSLLRFTQILSVLVVVQLINDPIIPTPAKVLTAFVDLFRTPEFAVNLLSTFGTVFYAMTVSIIITLVISYLSKVPFFEFVSWIISKCRFLTLPSLIFLFTFLTSNVGSLKSSLLIFGIVPFFTTSMLSIINSLTQQEIDKPFLNKKGPWHALYEVVIVGKLDQVLMVMSQNFAIAWTMITAVEGLAINEGGIGVMLIQSNKYMKLAPVLAMLLVVMLIGIAFDTLFQLLRKELFKYVK